MASTKQVKGAAPLNNGFGTFQSGDGVALFSTAHPTIAGTFKNTLATAADLNETSLEQVFDRHRCFDRRKRFKNCS